MRWPWKRKPAPSSLTMRYGYGTVKVSGSTVSLATFDSAIRAAYLPALRDALSSTSSVWSEDYSPVYGPPAPRLGQLDLFDAQPYVDWSAVEDDYEECPCCR